MMRRYIGRATGQRRKQKPPTLLISSGIAAVTGLILIAVFIMNPGADRSSREEGSRPSVGVTPDPTDTPTELSGTALL